MVTVKKTTTSGLAARSELPAEVKNVGGSLPAYLASEKDGSLDTMAQHRVLPRLKILQAMSSPDLRKEFGEGAVLVQPGNMFVGGPDQPFLFVPLFFFEEYCKWSDLNDSGSPTIMQRSFDPSSDIAAKAKNPDLRVEDYGDPKQKFQARYVQHLNFAGIVYKAEGNSDMIPVVMSFSRGEFSTGRNFCTSCFMRKGPLWSQVWQVGTTERHKDKYQWMGFKIDAPTDSPPFIKEEEVSLFRSMYQELEELHKKAMLSVDASEHDSDPVDAATAGETNY